MVARTGTYFSQFLEESAGGDRMDGTSDVRNVLEEVQMELIKNSMLKLWLEDFYNFCQVRWAIRLPLSGGVRRQSSVCLAPSAADHGV